MKDEIPHFAICLSVTVGRKLNWNKDRFDKRLACAICGKLMKYRIVAHLESVHKDDPKVATALNRKGKKKKMALQQLKHIGNFKHNLKVLAKGEGALIVARRPKKRCLSEDFTPCLHCLGFYKRADLWRHNKICAHRKKNEKEGCRESGLLANSILFLEGALQDHKSSTEKASTELRNLVLLKMRKDDITKTVESDELALKLGHILLQKLGSRRKANIAQRLRQLGRLSLELEEHNDDTRDLNYYVTGKGFDDIVMAVEQLAGLFETEEGIRCFRVPSLCLSLGNNLIKVAQIKKGMALRLNDECMRRDAENFIDLMHGEWADRISSVALTSLRTQKFNKPSLLPVTSDLVMLKDYQQREIPKKVKELEAMASYTIWKELAELTLSKIILFNKRRGSEAAKLLLQTFNNRPKWALHANEEILNGMNSVEKELLKR